ncbi:hypothetical protein [Micromonospora endophytica]|uniref:Uncharacterized protein n=1 Tax=Micromonospora endophytica TaxID=515350 RepID=A0A2W2C2P9_9ACTN|nr:hypothetical protein [Micromonospora endophytica]PZF92120.1 hypothetical protein C1I93_20130 [Micromonospora endophytica]RIW42849.1 hypothetical protein D3H59_21725 [Micromonospora endophytica]BCJ61641.1 hypothetical protein Jiend_50630 [Micromonospora endophytica]
MAPTTRTADTALTTAETAFALLTCEPAPLVFDARPVPGLPDTTLPLDQLRTLVKLHRYDSDTTDKLWRQLAHHARDWGPAWVVGAIGVALPALTHLAAKISRGRPQHADDVDSEVLAGFLHALRTADLDTPRLWLRLCWAAWRAGTTVITADDSEELPLDLATGSRTPRMPYGHPDLLLGRAAAAGLITADTAELISATRFGDALIEQRAADEGVASSALRMRRRRAERVVAAAVVRGDLSGPVRLPRHCKAVTAA